LPQTANTLLQKLDSAFKGIVDTGSLGDSVLQPEKYDRFIRQMQEKTKILDKARFIEMEAHQAEIDRIAFTGRVLHAGQRSDGTQVNDDPNKRTRPEFFVNKLEAKELHASTGIKDRALRRNIEKGNFEQTLIELFGQAAGRDMEEWAVFSDTELSFAEHDMFALTDGWVKKAENHVNAQGDEPSEVFDKLISGLPKKYLQDETEWVIYTDWELMHAYRKEVAKRETAGGDAMLLENKPLYYNGFLIEYSPMLSRHREYAEGDATSGAVAMLQHPDNMVWGVFHEVTIEPERDAGNRQTDFHLTFEGDVHYEDENAAVIAFVDRAEEEAV
jgi:hypothetical protein